MIYVGIDDTDTLEDPGTNQLARHLVRTLGGGRLILRHQLLEDPRVPCTRKNGCASILFEPRDSLDLIAALRRAILDWCPAGSDPGLCVAESVPPAIVAWGMRCQREFVAQDDARRLAAEANVYLEGLGGTEDGVIGALAAIGLLATGNDGRVIHLGQSEQDLFDVTGLQPVGSIYSQTGVAEIRCLDTQELVLSGVVDVGKRLRPNYRDGKAVLYVAPVSGAWQAVRVV